MNLSEDQQKAFKEIMVWLIKQDKPYWRLTGFAGCGKTVLIKEIISNIDNLLSIVVTLSWKAALVLRDKGIQASSIHSVFYRPDDVDAPFPTFVLRDSLPMQTIMSSTGQLGLIVIDEASMVTRRQRADILSFGIPVLFVGDSEQLPCIPDPDDPDKSEDDFLYDAESKLFQIHRQALNSPIIQLSMDIRNNKFIKYGKYGDGVFKLRHEEVTDKLLLNADQIICGKNDTRISLNNRVRKLKGYPITAMPFKGEKVIITRNSVEEGLFNGSLLTVAEDCDGEIRDSLYNPLLLNKYNVFTDTEEVSSIISYFPKRTVFPKFIEDEQKANVKYAKQAEFIRKNRIKEIDFAYAITAHKFQGSQAKKVLVYFEYMKDMDKESKRRWLYTAVTRAEEKLVLAM